MKKLVISGLLLALVAPALGQISNDRLCRAIGATPNVAVPPRDRAFFEDNCDCINDECAFKGSARHKQLVAAWKCEGAARELIAKELGRELSELEPIDDSTSDDVTWGGVIERKCMEVRSATRVANWAKPFIAASKRKDQRTNCIAEADKHALRHTKIDIFDACSANPDPTKLIDDLETEKAEMEKAEADRAANLQTQREKLDREVRWETPRWRRDEQEDYLRRCQELYPQQDPGRVATYCACMLERSMEDNPSVPPLFARRDDDDIKIVRARLAPARAECAEFAGVIPRD
jgi:hypothetical protein